MASEVGIANSCFRKIGVKQKIGTFNEGTAAANFASDRYPELRDELLRGHNWNFATKNVKLAKASTGPVVPSGWNYFTFPADWMRTVLVFDNDAGVGSLEYREEDRKLSIGREEAWMSYVYAVTDPNHMTPDFRETLSYAMAVEAAIDLVNSRSMSEVMEARYQQKLLKAMSTDAQSDGPRRLPRGSWVTNRFRGSPQIITS